jgi:hypothetical protein
MSPGPSLILTSTDNLLQLGEVHQPEVADLFAHPRDGRENYHCSSMRMNRLEVDVREAAREHPFFDG